ncbi:UNVERIFIED_CONTAM: hypothetical protein FKN15_011096 [Acipenser sinensis]
MDELPTFTVQPMSAVQKLGGPVTLRCRVEPPTANVSWRLNGHELRDSNASLEVLIQPEALIILALSNLTIGRYQCIARTAIGASASVSATVTAAKLRDFEADDQHEIEVDEGNTAVIECHLPESHPKAQVRYSVKQEWLETSKGNYLIMPSGNLQIVNATQEDEGTYKCAAYNPVTQEVKTSTSSDRLRIRRSTSEAARIIYPLGAQTIIVTKGQSLVLECVASGIPPPQVTWSKDGAGLHQQNKTRFLLSNLLIDATSEADSGTYSCQADNGVGEIGAAYIFYSVQVLDSTDDWTVTNIPGNLHRLTLVKLDPSSLYEVEMATKNCAGLGQAAMMTFRTGRSSGPEKILNDDPCSSSQNPSPSDNACLSPPEAPDRPTISMANETSVYVTWIPRGNRGFPIQSFCVEYKKLKGGDWTRATSNIPPSRLSVQISQLEKGDSYKFRVRAVNILGESRPSTPSKPYVVSSSHRVPVAGPIAGPHITYTEAINETTIMLKWMYTSSFNNNTPIHGFYIYYRPTDSDNDSDYKKDVVEARRYPRTTARPVSPHPNAGHREMPAVARSSDLPYLIVGVVLGAIVFIIVAFIPFCLWRAWAKQKQTSDLAFPAASPPVFSCQYTMVPLRGLAVPNGHCAADRATIALNGGHHPLSRNDNTTSGKHLNYCLGGLHQGEMECNSLLQENMMCNGRPAVYRYSEQLPEHDHEENSFLPDDSTHQLLNTGDHWDQASSVCHVTGSEAPCCRIEGAREINMNGGPPPCVAVLTPVEVESPETPRSPSNCSTQQPQDSPGPEVTEEEEIFSPNTTKEQSGQLQSNDKE